MIRAVLESHLDADDLVAGDRPLVHRFAEPLLHRGDVLGRDPAAGDLVLEDEGSGDCGSQRDQPADDVGVLARAAGLLLVLVVERRLDWSAPRGS